LGLNVNKYLFGNNEKADKKHQDFLNQAFYEIHSGAIDVPFAAFFTRLHVADGYPADHILEINALLAVRHGDGFFFILYL
jgi:hypothetical protein